MSPEDPEDDDMESDELSDDASEEDDNEDDDPEEPEEDKIAAPSVPSLLAMSFSRFFFSFFSFVSPPEPSWVCREALLWRRRRRLALQRALQERSFSSCSSGAPCSVILRSLRRSRQPRDWAASAGAWLLAAEGGCGAVEVEEEGEEEEGEEEEEEEEGEEEVVVSG